MTLPPVYPIVDGPLLAARGLSLCVAAEALLDAGMRILQLRWKEGYSREVYAQAQTIAGMCRDAGALFIVNDRADVAKLLGAGLHVGQDDLPASVSRTLVGPETLIGLSTHNEEQYRAALSEPVDYIAVGPIFGTTSKLNPDAVVGTQRLRAIVNQPETANPVVAIGGITRENAVEVWRAGATSVSVIGDLYPPETTRQSVRRRAEEWLQIAAAGAIREN